MTGLVLSGPGIDGPCVVGPVLSGNEQADLHGPTVPRSSGGSPPCGRDRIQLAFGTARSARATTPTMLGVSRTESIGPSPTATTNNRRPPASRSSMPFTRPPIPARRERATARRPTAAAGGRRFDARREPVPLDHPRTPQARHCPTPSEVYRQFIRTTEGSKRPISVGAIVASARAAPLGRHSPANAMPLERPRGADHRQLRASRALAGVCPPTTGPKRRALTPGQEPSREPDPEQTTASAPTQASIRTDGIRTDGDPRLSPARSAAEISATHNGRNSQGPEGSCGSQHTEEFDDPGLKPHTPRRRHIRPRPNPPDAKIIHWSD